MNFFRKIRWLAWWALPVAAGVPISYELPQVSSGEQTYLVTLAIVDAKNPDWVISTFVAGQPRTVKPGQSKFTEEWNGLDDNFMPVPPGDYAVKGIYTPARKWPVDQEYHAVTAQFHSGVSPWLPSPQEPEHWKIPMPFHGDPVNSPLRDVKTTPDGTAVFYYQYLENGRNCPMFDLNQPTGMKQFLRAFNSGGAGGGPCAATDGQTVWACTTDGTPDFIYRADAKPFGNDHAPHRRNGYLPPGRVVAMAATRDAARNKSYVYVMQRGKLELIPVPGRRYPRVEESEKEFIDQITVHDGADGKLLTTLKLSRPQAMVARGEALYVLYREQNKWQVGRYALKDGLPADKLERVFVVPESITPYDLAVDGKNRFYLSDSAANRVYQLNASGRVLRHFGRLAQQEPGSYDPLTLMAPGKIASWTDREGSDRLLIVENDGPNRVSEWSCEDGKLLREFPTYQTKANNGYAVDPAHPDHIYLPGHNGWLTRFKVDYDAGSWKVDAVWPGVEAGQRRGLDKPVAVRANNRTLYLASEQNTTIYRLTPDGKRWLRSAGIVSQGTPGKDLKYFIWRDANGNGEQEAAELTPTELPGWVLTYHGQRWLPDLSYLAMSQGGRDIWMLSPSGFDEHGNPVFKEWRKVVTDPIFAARAAGNPEALRGGNELDDRFSSDWMQADGENGKDLYVQARGGRNFSANFGAQYKISHYTPDQNGVYQLKWRVGRAKLGAAAERGELEGGMRIFKPMNGILAVIDQSRSGVFLYTDEGLYVDTLFPPGNTREEVGVYRQPGEFFAGTVYPNAENGKIYYASGKYTPLLYELEGWSLRENPVKKLTSLPEKVTLKAGDIADPPELALSLRGGAGKAHYATIRPAIGGVQLDGSLTGWESADPVVFSGGRGQSVEARCLYDPEHLYFRWQLRFDSKFEPKPLPPLERVFTHDQGADTVSVFLQGDPEAPVNGPAAGRPGDVRMIFGVFRDGDKVVPVAVGFFPDWPRPDGKPQGYRTPVGEARFAHVGALAGAKLGYRVDDDGKGLVIAAEIPRSALPGLKQPLAGGLRTRINFDANFGGHHRFWWANSDGSANTETYDEPSEARFYPGSWAPVRLVGLEQGVVPKNWLILGPFGGPGAEKFSRDPRTGKEEILKFYEQRTYPPDNDQVDPNAQFSGEQLHGYWGKPARITWRPVSLAELDTRVIVGDGSQVWYGATWIYSPETTKVKFELQGHRMTTIRWRLNGEDISVPDKAYRDVNNLSRRVAEREVTLKQGWNQLSFRAVCVGYAPFRVGVVIQAPEALAWKLRLSGLPPKGK